MLPCAAVCAACAAFDRVTKALAERYLTRSLTGSLFRLRLVRNTGAAFSLLGDRPGIVIAVTFALLAAIAVCAFRAKSRAESAAYGAIFAGGASNLYDRLAHGAVTDFIEPVFVRFAVFNFADICVCGGAALLLLLLLVRRK